MNTKSSAIRRARHQLRVIQAKRRARVADIAATQQIQSRALGFGVCDSIRYATCCTGRGMPHRSRGLMVVALVVFVYAVLAFLMLIAARLI